MDKGSYNFRKPIDKTPAEYAPMKITFKQKVNLADLPIKEKRSHKWLLIIILAYLLVMGLITWFGFGLFEMARK